MRAVQAFEGGVRLVEVPEPTGEGVRVRVKHVGICGSDLGMVAAGGFERVTLGHEISGVLDDGTPVAIEPLLPCGACNACLAGRYNLCAEDRWLGGSVDGGMTEEVVVPERCLVFLPDGLSLRDAFLAEPVAVGLHGLRRAEVQAGERVAIVGAGSIGLLSAASAISLGCDVTVVARHEHQAELARRVGARVDPDAADFDLVVAAGGGAAGVDAAVGLTRPGGRVLVLTEPREPFMPAAAVFREVNAITSLAYAGNGRRDIDDAAALLASAPVLADIVTHRFPLDEAVEAFRVAGDRRSGAVKVALEP
jgi:threonine dehydrogenase-like Zn-dependent dehydrogenase